MNNNSDKKIATFGIYESLQGADSAISKFKLAGFTSDEVSALWPEGTKHEMGTQNSTKAPEGAAAGGATGAVLGGALGWLVGIGSLAIPGVGPLVAAGPILAALSGMSVGGAVGALSGSLVGMGIPEYEAQRYEGRVKDGGILVSVHCTSDKKCTDAKRIFEETGASDISSSSEKSSGKNASSESRAAI